MIIHGKIEHFQRRLKNSTNKWLIYVWYFKIMKTPFRHPNFILNYKEQNSFKMFLDESEKINLL